jgi:hypothetical protein
MKTIKILQKHFSPTLMTHLGSNINVAEFISSSTLKQIAAGEKERKHFKGQEEEVGTIYVQFSSCT